MSSELPEEFSKPPASTGRQTFGDRQGGDNTTTAQPARSDDTARDQATVLAHGETVRSQEPKSPPADSPPKNPQTTVIVRGETVGDQTSTASPTESVPKDTQATVVVRGETVGDQGPKASSADSARKESSSQDKGSSSKDRDSPSKDKDSSSKDKEKRPRKDEAKVKMQSRLPALDDDADVGVQKEQIVTRDGKADLAFTGTLIASAAPPSAPQGQWQEYRIYETNAGKHVFSKVSRSVIADHQDTHEAEVFDPSPSSMPSQLLRSARDLTRSRPLTWMDAAADFFGYDPLAKTLYRKLNGQFEERIS